MLPIIKISGILEICVLCGFLEFSENGSSHVLILRSGLWEVFSAVDDRLVEFRG